MTQTVQFPKNGCCSNCQCTTYTDNEDGVHHQCSDCKKEFLDPDLESLFGRMAKVSGRFASLASELRELTAQHIRLYEEANRLLIKVQTLSQQT